MKDFKLSDSTKPVRAQIQLLNEVVIVLYSSIDPPQFNYHSEDEYGFRFAAPTAFHFCLLKLARSVSALNSMYVLFEKGFAQEINVLARTLLEFTSQAEFVAASIENGVLSDTAETVVAEYFADARRTRKIKITRSNLTQKLVHNVVGAETDKARNDPNWRASIPSEFSDECDLLDSTSAELMRAVYGSYSAYVHGRYPETMDLIGGIGPQLHLNGMRNTPKDAENANTIETLSVTVSLALKVVVAKFDLSHLFERHTKLRLWLRSDFEAYK